MTSGGYLEPGDVVALTSRDDVHMNAQSVEWYKSPKAPAPVPT